MTVSKPTLKPRNPCFSSGPCAKRPGWSWDGMKGALLGRSHRSAEGKKKIHALMEKHRIILKIPADYKIAVVPASDTGAIEMAMWNMMGARGVDVLAWEVFGQEWLKDITKQLKLKDVRTFEAKFGEIPDLSKTNPDRDIIFTWNGTTSGVCVPDGNWIKKDRKGLTFCDATSAVFAWDMPWDRLDVTTWSWQKVLGGEAAHGMLVLSPRAVERLLSYTPDRPLPKIFRLTAGNRLIDEVFEGATINTVSMMAVEDCLDALVWVESIGGLPETMNRARKNFRAVDGWIAKTPWIDHLALKPDTRSLTSVCMKITDPAVAALDEEGQQNFIKAMTKLLEKEGVAFDIASHRMAPPGLRLWCGATVEESDLAAVFPWLEWAFETAMAEQRKKAA